MEGGPYPEIKIVAIRNNGIGINLHKHGSAQSVITIKNKIQTIDDTFIVLYAVSNLVNRSL
jgi:hypothetical protein